MSVFTIELTPEEFKTLFGELEISTDIVENGVILGNSLAKLFSRFDLQSDEVLLGVEIYADGTERGIVIDEYFCAEEEVERLANTGEYTVTEEDR